MLGTRQHSQSYECSDDLDTFSTYLTLNADGTSDELPGPTFLYSINTLIGANNSDATGEGGLQSAMDNVLNSVASWFPRGSVNPSSFADWEVGSVNTNKLNTQDGAVFSDTIVGVFARNE